MEGPAFAAGGGPGGPGVNAGLGGLYACEASVLASAGRRVGGCLRRVGRDICCGVVCSEDVDETRPDERKCCQGVSDCSLRELPGGSVIASAQRL